MKALKEQLKDNQSDTWYMCVQDIMVTHPRLDKIQDISLKTTSAKIMKKNVSGRSVSLGFIMWRPWISVPSLVDDCPIIVEATGPRF